MAYIYKLKLLYKELNSVILTLWSKDNLNEILISTKEAILLFRDFIKKFFILIAIILATIFMPVLYVILMTLELFTAMRDKPKYFRYLERRHIKGGE